MSVTVAALVACAAQPVEHIQAPQGFVVERIHDATPDEGSWVCMDFDDQGRLVIAPERGPLLRLTMTDAGVDVDPLETPVQRAQGLLHHGDSLYCNVNAPLAEGGGLHRLRDQDGDGVYEMHALLAAWDWGGEHGAHAIALAPDGQSLYLIHGNHVRPPEPLLEQSPLQHYEEDVLLERIWDPRGHAVGRMAPAGYVVRTDFDGSAFELIAGGLRNPYDIAFDSNGELFTYDADMEWDIGTGWYRYPRVVHVVSGGETGWRGGSAKWSDAWPDANPPVVETNVGSPTGIRFPYDSSFPEPWRSSLLISDWSWGRVYAVQLQPDGAGWSGNITPFLKGKPFNITDLDVGTDGHLYCITGGRGTSSSLYRVRWTGKEIPAEQLPGSENELRTIRRTLEQMHDRAHLEQRDYIVHHLGNDDRAVRFAARVALERIPMEMWPSGYLHDEDIVRRTELLIASARVGDDATRQRVLDRVGELMTYDPSRTERIGLLRAAMIAMSRSTSLQADPLGDVLIESYPSGDLEIDRLQSTLLVALDHPEIVPATLDLIEDTSSHAEQLHYALPIRLATHWSDLDRSRFQEWAAGARRFEGGLSVQGFVEAIAKPVLGEDTPPLPESAVDLDTDALPSLHAWSMTEVLPHLPRMDEPARSIERGQKAFTDALCIRCHRFDGTGGDLAPDLTSIAARFSRRDLLHAILEPSAAITDQYAASRIQLRDGTTLSGRITEQDDQRVTIMIDPYGTEYQEVPMHDVESIEADAASTMPAGLVNGLTIEQLLDLLAYLERTP
ncbi:MAG: c-type cytochrome [Phycisphaerales bacterium]|nr:c-type cytochrome [Phycisphaerales bacterium]